MLSPGETPTAPTSQTNLIGGAQAADLSQVSAPQNISPRDRVLTARTNVILKYASDEDYIIAAQDRRDHWEPHWKMPERLERQIEKADARTAFLIVNGFTREKAAEEYHQDILTRAVSEKLITQARADDLLLLLHPAEPRTETRKSFIQASSSLVGKMRDDFLNVGEAAQILGPKERSAIEAMSSPNDMICAAAIKMNVIEGQLALAPVLMHTFGRGLGESISVYDSRNDQLEMIMRTQNIAPHELPQRALAAAEQILAARLQGDDKPPTQICHAASIIAAINYISQGVDAGYLDPLKAAEQRALGSGGKPESYNLYDQRYHASLPLKSLVNGTRIPGCQFSTAAYMMGCFHLPHADRVTAHLEERNPQGALAEGKRQLQSVSRTNYLIV